MKEEEVRRRWKLTNRKAFIILQSIIYTKCEAERKLKRKTKS